MRYLQFHVIVVSHCNKFIFKQKLSLIVCEITSETWLSVKNPETRIKKLKSIYSYNWTFCLWLILMWSRLEYFVEFLTILDMVAIQKLTIIFLKNIH